VVRSGEAAPRNDSERATVDDLSDVGRMVYLAFMKTDADAGALGDDLFEKGRRTAEEALLQEAHKVGCSVLSVHLTTGELLSWVRDRSDWSGRKVCDTYNRDLINAIAKIIAEVPTANRWVVAYRLQGWEAARQGWKAPQIQTTEAFEIDHYARMRFYEMNAVEDPKFYFGYSLQCELCQRIAAKNPHTRAEAERIGLPHIGCLDHWNARGGKTVDCDDLWLGQ